MNELTLHEEYAYSHPDDRLASRSLVDHLEEQEGVTHRQALRRVAKHRKARRDANQMAEAAAILGAHDDLARAVEQIIRTAGAEDWRLLGTIIIVPGSRYPSVARNQFSAGVRGYWKDTIRVGARRVLAIAAALNSDDVDELNYESNEGHGYANS